MFVSPHTLSVDKSGNLWLADNVGDGHTGGGTATGNARIMKFDKEGKFIPEGRKGMGAGEFDVIYVADSESRDGRTNTGQFGLAQTGYGYNLGAGRGIRIGSAKDGSVK
jgi:hypothetical protein